MQKNQQKQQGQQQQNQQIPMQADIFDINDVNGNLTNAALQVYLPYFPGNSAADKGNLWDGNTGAKLLSGAIVIVINTGDTGRQKNATLSNLPYQP